MEVSKFSGNVCYLARKVNIFFSRTSFCREEVTRHSSRYLYNAPVMVKLLWRHCAGSVRRVLHSPFGLQLFSLSFLIFFVMGFQPPYLAMGQPFGDEIFGEQILFAPITEMGFLDNFAGIKTAGMEEIWVEDESGQLVKKFRPQKRDSVVTYAVKSGDTVSKISHKFGLKVSTVLWANGLTSKTTLRIGKDLRIPPTDGVFYTAKPGDMLGDIAKQHGIALDKISAYNRVGKDLKLEIGQELFLPQAKKVFVQQSSGIGNLGSLGFRIRRPTKGVLTQGYHRKHYALDIANKMNTPIYAAAPGKVIKSDDGWNYGYGKYIVVDHGSGVKTLYGHLNSRKVFVGDEIKAGQLVGLMGNTGRVWGPTGIHLHFELHIKGRKVNPNNYF